MLDTTYCAPRWAFPPQQEAVAALAQLMAAEAAAATAEGGRLLCVVGSYHIGKVGGCCWGLGRRQRVLLGLEQEACCTSLLPAGALSACGACGAVADRGLA